MTTIPTEFVLAIFNSLWEDNDLCASACLALTCKPFYAIHKALFASFSPCVPISLSERSFRPLSFVEQASTPAGVMVIGPPLRLLLCPHRNSISKANRGSDPCSLIPKSYARWGKFVLLKRKQETDVFCAYRAFRTPKVGDKNFRWKMMEHNSFMMELKRVEWFEIAGGFERVGMWVREEMLEFENVD